MKTLRVMIGLCALLLLLASVASGCVSRNETLIAQAEAKSAQARSDSLAAQARADGMAAQAAAQAASAQAAADAKIGVAQANSQTAIVREQEKTTRETAWLSTLPWLALIVILAGGLVAGVLLVLWYRGKAHLIVVQAQAQGAMMLPAPQPHRPLPQPRETRTSRMLPGPVADRARETGTQAVPGAAGCWLLVDVDQNVVEVMEPRRG